MTLTLTTAAARLDRSSAAGILIQRALDAIASRERLDADHQLPAATACADELERRLAAAGPAYAADPRIVVLAIKMHELAGVERVRAATRVREQHRGAQAAAAGRARAQRAVDLPVAAIRTWCRANNIEVPRRGRFLPDHAVSAWSAAHPDHPAAQVGLTARSSS